MSKSTSIQALLLSCMELGAVVGGTKKKNVVRETEAGDVVILLVENRTIWSGATGSSKVQTYNRLRQQQPK